MFTCPTCRVEGTPGALYCGSCGSRLVADAAPGADPLVGHTVHGTYYIEQKIGSGGMGDVYRAVHRNLDAPVALKIVKRELLSHPAMVHRFQREARAASRLRHPNVVAVTDFGQTEDGMLFMVMEYVNGRSLATVIADDAPLPEPRVVRIGAQILSALAEAHARGILHRDLKPENVMIEIRRDEPDAVKVLDFGIAKVLAAGGAASTLTQAGLVCGTPGYMSPEQLRGGDVDARSDLFSVGIVLYEMLTHKLPFDVQTPMEMLHKHLSQPVPPPSARGPLPITPALEELVMRALSPAPDDRPASAVAMREELLEAARLAPGAGGEAPRLPTEVLPRRSSPSPPNTPAPPAARARTTSAPPRPPPRPGSGTAALTRTGVSSGTSTLRSSAFDPALLKKLEERLAPVLGPVAPHLVRKTSRTATTVDDLCRRLATHLPTEKDQEELLTWSGTALRDRDATRARGRTPPPARTPAVSWDPAVLDQARRDLAVYLGPLARIIVRRLSCRARDVHELYELLGREIPSEVERAAFRRLTPREPGSHP